MQFDMNATWSRATSLVGRNFQLLAIIAGIFLLLPSLVMYMAVPEFATLAMPAGDPQQMEKQVEAMLPTLLGWTGVLLVISMIGYMAMIALMGESRPTVGEALKRAARAFPSAVGAGILFLIVYIAVFFVGIMITAALAAVTGSPAVTIILLPLILLAVAFVLIRFVITLPIIVLDPEPNPLTAMKKSWQLTGPRKWAIFGFWVLLTIAYFVIAILIMSVVGLMGALAPTSSGTIIVLGLVNGIIGALVAMLLSGILVAMYQQLSGPTAEAVSETFE